MCASLFPHSISVIFCWTVSFAHCRSGRGICVACDDEGQREILRYIRWKLTNPDLIVNLRHIVVHLFQVYGVRKPFAALSLFARRLLVPHSYTRAHTYTHTRVRSLLFPNKSKWGYLRYLLLQQINNYANKKSIYITCGKNYLLLFGYLLNCELGSWGLW